MDAILDETLDRALWQALWYQQGEAISQAAIGESRALSAALDAAATSGNLGGKEEADLWTRVQEERLRYFTPTGRPTLERSAVEEKLTGLREQARGLRAQLAALDSSAERYRRLRTELGESGARQVEQVALVEKYEAQWKRLEASSERSRAFGSRLKQPAPKPARQPSHTTNAFASSMPSAAPQRRCRRWKQTIGAGRPS